ncbi:hypothetical protein THASP1DRAFT_29893 [Thamnocephalis sphaerospora]|uniref:Zn(2)-C6 fungal-type domain-containing protein n=1 Tax=Thamnocephalis sphaerospora TaxID=78915 RepID=A0A4P9XQI1_9FUNG|nr:hypothetical protein THASP1DRAFT_29893 [Thamnocephalis sphaerospora]|eukprot:RKP08303.1 hypothetical protein THASP1DRAFT_29893 [Thamnocephalis sphaerospora]
MSRLPLWNAEGIPQEPAVDDALVQTYGVTGLALSSDCGKDTQHPADTIAATALATNLAAALASFSTAGAVAVPTSSQARDRKRRRQRRAFSCDVCRRRKVRCDQRRPTCTSCLKHGAACVYATAELGALTAELRDISKRKSKRRALAPSKPNALQAVTCMHVVAGRNSSTSSSSSPPSPRAANVPLQPVKAVQPPSLDLPTMQPPLHGDQIAKGATTTTMTPKDISTRGTEEHTLATDAAAHMQSTLAAAAAAVAAHQPTLSAAEQLQTSACLTADSVATSWTDSLSPNCHLQTAFSTQLTISPTVYPDVPLIHHLVSLYMTHVHTQLPMFTLGWIQHEQQTSSIPAAIILATMAIGTHYTRAVVNPRALGRVLAEQARARLSRTMAVPSLKTALAALLVSTFMCSEGDGPSAFALQHLALRTIKQADTRGGTGMAGQEPALSRRERDKRETWRRIRWGCFMVDRFACIPTGMPMAMQEHECSALLPTEEPSDVTGGEASSTSGSTSDDNAATAAAARDHSDRRARTVQPPPRFKYAHLVRLVAHVGRVVLHRRACAPSSQHSPTSGVSSDAVLGQIQLETEWRRAATLLPSFEDMYAELERTVAAHAVPVSSAGAPMVDHRPPPTLPWSVTPDVIVSAAQPQSLLDLHTAMYNVFAHALHRTALLLLLRPNAGLAPPTPPAGMSDMHLNLSHFMDVAADWGHAAHTAPLGMTCPKTSSLSTRLGAALEIVQAAQHVPASAVSLMTSFYSYCLGIAGEAFLDLIEDPTAWPLLDPALAVGHLAQLADMLGKLSHYWALAELYRVRLVVRLWMHGTLALQHVSVSPGGARLLATHALQSASYPGTLWDPGLLADTPEPSSPAGPA